MLSVRKISYKIMKTLKRCWREISFKDKGLILIMIVLLLQCIHNLYSADPIKPDYISVDVIVRTSVAGIFGYFLSSNFLTKNTSNGCEDIDHYKIELLDTLLNDKEIREKIEEQYKDIKNKEEEEKERYQCNKTLQNGIAVGLCILIILCLIIGVNLKLIPEGTTATLSQFRDIVSGCIGFLLGNGNVKK